ncbi:hypothetical protein UFOVP235_13 [uncultured Caudovirales phage]|uniref:Uncharacterized protein n=1 Tax=uncultured Caudovirales phage TaxID=2100421 RepID=A0A6J7WTT8_9CAUD|nr:hypothetical protein UFOVP235_13 [uncultured Caudovirales phage]
MANYQDLDDVKALITEIVKVVVEEAMATPRFVAADRDALLNSIDSHINNAVAAAVAPIATSLESNTSLLNDTQASVSSAHSLIAKLQTKTDALDGSLQTLSSQSNFVRRRDAIG